MRAEKLHEINRRSRTPFIALSLQILIRSPPSSHEFIRKVDFFFFFLHRRDTRVVHKVETVCQNTRGKAEKFRKWNAKFTIYDETDTRLDTFRFDAKFCIFYDEKGQEGEKFLICFSTNYLTARVNKNTRIARIMVD